MPENSSNNKRIAKNTLLLYIRMLMILTVSLYTSRIVLATLGIEDYGLYNVVGGIVTMFTFVNLAMSNASNRFITFALGKGDKQELHDVVSATCMIHWIIAGIIFVLAETVGLWFLHNKIVIPEGRSIAVEWVYQFSVVSCMVSIISVPYNAMIIAHEKMGTFAFVSVLDAILKLLIVYIIQLSSKDKLIVYAALILCVNVFNRLLYQFYCRRHFEESKHIQFKKVPQMRDVASFAGWSLFGNLAFMGYTQGLNIILNMFFGPAVNAARGVAVQVESAIKGFVTNFQTAVNPQIIKSYAQGDFRRLHMLIYSSSKFSFFLLYCMVLPICIESDAILNIWLKDVPDYTVIFTILILVISLSEPLRNPIDRANMATGKIRTYQIVEGITLMLIVPVAYVILRLGGAPYSVFIVQLVIMYLVQIIRLFLVCHKINMSKREYVKRVLLRVFAVAVTSSIVPLVLYYYMPSTLLMSIIIVVVSVVSVLVCSYFIGLTPHERSFVNTKLDEIKSKFIK